MRTDSLLLIYTKHTLARRRTGKYLALAEGHVRKLNVIIAGDVSLTPTRGGPPIFAQANEGVGRWDLVLILRYLGPSIEATNTGGGLGSALLDPIGVGWRGDEGRGSCRRWKVWEDAGIRPMTTAIHNSEHDTHHKTPSKIEAH